MSHFEIPGDPKPNWLDDDSFAPKVLPSGYKKITDAKAQQMRDALIPAPTRLDQIRTLEAMVTPRRMREAVLGIDGGWLANVDAQIATLRA